MSNLPSDTPRLPKWPFLVGDVALIGVAITLALRNPAPLSPALIFAITGCIALAAILGAIPFLADYAAQQDEALDERQRGLDALTRTVAGSADQISAAASGLHELGELARAQVERAQLLPEKFKAEIEILQNEQHDSLTAENKNLQKELKSLREKEAKKIGELAEKLQHAIAEIEKLKLAPSPSRKTRAAIPKPNVHAPEPGPETTPAPSEPKTQKEPSTEENKKTTPSAPQDKSQPEAIRTESVSDHDSDPVADESPRPPQEESPPEGGTTEDSTPTLSLDEPEAPKTDRSISPDGVTRLLVSAYIGIGNRLFVRGAGAGLSEDKGVPLQFVSIGKWQWETSEADAPLQVRLYKNDEIECTALGQITIDPGSQSEVSATF